jgi:hypothetical protein
MAERTDDAGGAGSGAKPTCLQAICPFLGCLLGLCVLGYLGYVHHGFLGAAIGAVVGFIAGFIIGAIVARIIPVAIVIGILLLLLWLISWLCGGYQRFIPWGKAIQEYVCHLFERS